MSSILAIANAAQLICVARHGQPVKTGPRQSELTWIADGGALIADGRIQWLGPTAEMAALPPGATLIDARNRIVLPGLIDSHTHLVFAGTRCDEFDQRLAGGSYQEIASRGGGIHATVRHTRAASKAELKELTLLRLERMLKLGITTVEIKSGYGLTLHDELKCLEVVRELQSEQPCELVPTFMGAHETPVEYRHRRGEYLRLLCEQMIPTVAERRLAEFCDVFCEEGVFTVEESELVLTAAQRHGLGRKVHADEFTALCGAELAARMGAVSADHLLKVTDAGIAALRESGTVGTLLPGTAFFLGLPYAPARRLIDAGVPVALATDANPGSCMTENLWLIGTMACTQMKMLSAEVLTALTLNAAAALGRSDRLGSLEVGKQADLIICDVPDYRELFYHFGINHVRTVIKSGHVVVAR